MKKIELKMVVTKVLDIPDELDEKATIILENALETLTNQAKDSKVSVFGEFLYVGIDDERDIIETDIDNVFFLGVIKND